MTTLHHEIRINAPVDAVWNVLGDLVAVERYNPMVKSAKLLSEQQEGVGAGRHCELKPKGWVEERVWDWQPPRAIGLEVAASDWPVVFMKWRTELTAGSDATLVSQEMSYKLKFGPLGRLMDALVMRRKLDKSVAEILGSLKQCVESSSR
jgi:ligand-binding SRPBCC domain-containing protein